MISGSGQPCDMPTTASHDGKSARESSRPDVWLVPAANHSPKAFVCTTYSKV